MFLAALVAICVVTALDFAVQANAVFVELLVVGPIIAAFGATARDTAIVGLIAFLAAIPIGLAGDTFGSAEHLVGAAAVAIVGALSTGVAKLRFEREHHVARRGGPHGRR